MSSRRITDLERLTQPGNKVLPDDESIPVLTERLSLPSLELDVSLPEGTADEGAAAEGAAAAAAEEEAAKDAAEPHAEEVAAPLTTFPAPLPDPASDGELDADFMNPVDFEASALPVDVEAAEPDAIDWAQVEQDARDTLLRELQARLASEIDRQLRERLQPTLVRMLLATVTELRPAIEAAVRESVARVVAAEVARQRSHK